MEEKTKSTLAHVASIITAIGGIVTAILTSQANDTKGERIYETLKERVTIQGEHIRMLEEDKKVKDAWIIQHLTDAARSDAMVFEASEEPSGSVDGDGIPDDISIDPDAPFEEQFKIGASHPPPPPPEPQEKPKLKSPEELFGASKAPKDPAWGQMPTYKSL